MAMASSLPPGFERALGSLPVHLPVQANVVVPNKARDSKKVSWAVEDNLCQVIPPSSVHPCLFV